MDSTDDGRLAGLSLTDHAVQSDPYDFHAPADDEPFSMAELQSALANGIWQFSRHPELQDRLRAERALIKPFCEEVMMELRVGFST
ncbi:MAG: hypothetical protein GC201_02095 [Alphaproteobacteria bacterium]|nr:hypothetical protein [Alphaproteobacteria bacterium]